MYACSHELPEVEASSEIDTVLCNGDLSDPESEECFGTHILNYQNFMLSAVRYNVESVYIIQNLMLMRVKGVSFS